MRVLTVSHYQPFYGGAELLLYYLCRYMDRQGIPNTLIAPRISPELGKALSEASSKSSGSRSTTKIIESGCVGQLSQISSLTDMVREYAGDADVINVHNFPATISVNGVQKPTVWMCNEPPEVFLNVIKENIIKRMARLAMIRVNKWFARGQCTNAVVADRVNAERFKKLYGYNPVIIPYGVDYDYWNVEKRRTKADEFMILQVGTVTPLKNQIASIRAMTEVVKEIPNAVLWLVGTLDKKSDYFKKIRHVLSKNKLEGHVYFLGNLNRVELRGLYGRAHVVVHPIKPQGGWLTPFEALSAKVPVIVGSEATTADLIRSNALGFVSSDEMLADTIKEVHAHYADYQEKTYRAAEWVRVNLTWDKYCESFVDVMKQSITDYVRGGVNELQRV